MEEKNKNNIGCLVVVALWVIGSLIYTLFKTDSQSIYGFGMTIVGVAIACGAYFLIKHFASDDKGDSKEKSDKKGCLIAIAVVIGAITLYNLIGKQGEIGYTVGIIGIIVFALIIGYLFYSNFKY